MMPVELIRMVNLFSIFFAAAVVNNVVFYSLVDSVGAREFPPPLLFEVSFYKDI